jgi:hypothetical protein
MFCATIIVAAQCTLACGGEPEEFQRAWRWPASIRWDSGFQKFVDDHGPLPPLPRGHEQVIWMVPAEPGACAPVPTLKHR